MVENEALANAAAVEDAPAAIVEGETEPSAPEAAESEPEAAPDEISAAPASGQASLTLKRAGVETGDVFCFGPPAVIGRFDPAVGPVEVDLGVIDEGRYVSRKHAKITCEDGAWMIHDLGSSNGTYLLRSDFEKVDEAELTDGAEIAFGNARFVFRVGATEETEQPVDEPDQDDPPET